VATVSRHRIHDSLFDTGLPAARMTPAQMFSHGIARAGYLEVPRDPQRAYEFLRVVPRTIQPKRGDAKQLGLHGRPQARLPGARFVDEFALRELLKRWNLSMGS
jgi:hypothetical protein